MIYLTVTVGDYNTLLDRFIKYYRKIGIKNFLILLQGNNYKESLKILKEYDIKPSCIWTEEFSESLKVSYERDVIDSFCDKEDWIVYTDLDEFQYHNDIEDTVRYCEENKKKFLYGRLLDRISLTGELIKIDRNKSLEEQFPLGCYFTEKVLKAWDRKIILAKKDLVIGGGHHIFLDNSTLTPLKYIKSRRYKEIHHFKWDSSLLDRIEKYLKYKDNSLYYWRKEMAEFIKYFKQNNLIPIKYAFKVGSKLRI